jgi:hypothetical protein
MRVESSSRSISVVYRQSLGFRFIATPTAREERPSGTGSGKPMTGQLGFPSDRLSSRREQMSLSESPLNTLILDDENSPT